MLRGSDLFDKNGIMQKPEIILKKNFHQRTFELFDCNYKNRPLFIPHSMNGYIQYDEETPENELGLNLEVDDFNLIVSKLEVLFVEGGSGLKNKEILSKIRELFNYHATIKTINFSDLLNNKSYEAVHQHVFFAGDNEKMWILATNPGYYMNDDEFKIFQRPTCIDEYDSRLDKRRIRLNAMIEDENQESVRVYKIK